MRRIFAFALILCPVLADAQTATLVRDVNPAAYVPVEDAAAPQQFKPVAAGAVFFTPGNDADPTSRLWVTDGTAAGTRFLAQFCETGSCFHAPLMAATLPGLAFFYAESDGDPQSNPRLWRTDGTPAGTFPLTPLLNQYSYGDDSIATGNRLLFSSCVEEGSRVCSLWGTDGTVAGTSVISGNAGSGFVQAQGSIYFLGGNDHGLYRTDGTRQGTRLVKALPPGTYLWNLVSAESRLFFQSGPDSGEVWTSDGTAAGTRLVRSFGESGHDFIPRMTSILKPIGNGKVVLTGIRDSFVLNLWQSDGTRAGTVRLTNAPTVEGFWVPRADQIVKIGKRLVFSAGIGSSRRLWASEGSLATTKALDRCPGGCPEVLPDSALVQAGNRILFAARNAAKGAELWISDGTGPGTRLLSDLCPGSCGSEPRGFRMAGGLAWFRATVSGSPQLVRTDGTAAGTVVLGRLGGGEGFQLDLAVSGGRVFFPGFDAQYGAQPWVTDGTRAGTRRVTGLPGQGGSSDPKDLTAFGGRLLFTADDGTGLSFWLADGSGASPVPGTAGLPAPADVTAVSGPGGIGGLAYFVSGTSELWRTDGTAPGTVRLAGFPGQTLGELTGFGGRLLFFTTPSPALWASDGTAAGTLKLFDLPGEITRVSDAAAVGAEIYFAAETGARSQVFRSDGTADGTRAILDLPCKSCTDPDYPLSFVRAGDSVYFTAWAQETRFTGPALWRTDGTAAGTTQVLPDPARPGGLRIYFPSDLFAFGGDLYFFAGVAGNATHQVVFRGRDEASAVRLAPWGSEPFKPFSPDWTPVGGTLFFRAWDLEHGVELWKTGGTPEGTILVKDILGKGSSYPRDLTAAGGRLYFSAQDGVHGRELWVSDGTEAGTRLVQDLFPGGLSSDPEQLLLVGGRLFFTADDGVVGREPWSLAVE